MLHRFIGSYGYAAAFIAGGIAATFAGTVFQQWKGGSEWKRLAVVQEKRIDRFEGWLGYLWGGALVREQALRGEVRAAYQQAEQLQELALKVSTARGQALTDAQQEIKELGEIARREKARSEELESRYTELLNEKPDFRDWWNIPVHDDARELACGVLVNAAECADPFPDAPSELPGSEG